jgi:hypothetical protein
MGLTKSERDAGYRPVPQPGEYTVGILRRVARGFLLVTHTEDGQTLYCYDDGTVISDKKGRAVSGRAVREMIKNGWLIPVKGESLLEDGPPQRYRARTPEDGLLPRWRKR